MLYYQQYSFFLLTFHLYSWFANLNDLHSNFYFLQQIVSIYQQNICASHSLTSLKSHCLTLDVWMQAFPKSKPSLTAFFLPISLAVYFIHFTLTLPCTNEPQIRTCSPSLLLNPNAFPISNSLLNDSIWTDNLLPTYAHLSLVLLFSPASKHWNHLPSLPQITI